MKAGPATGSPSGSPVRQAPAGCRRRMRGPRDRRRYDGSRGRAPAGPGRHAAGTDGAGGPGPPAQGGLRPRARAGKVPADRTAARSARRSWLPRARSGRFRAGNTAAPESSPTARRRGGLRGGPPRPRSPGRSSDRCPPPHHPRRWPMLWPRTAGPGSRRGSAGSRLSTSGDGQVAASAALPEPAGACRCPPSVVLWRGTAPSVLLMVSF